MKEYTLDEITNLDDGMPIPSFKTHVTEVYDRKSGTNKFGVWSFQDVATSDGKTVVKLKLINREDFKGLKGRDVSISSTKGNNGIVGLKWAIEEYNGKKYPKVHVTDEALVSVDGEAETASDEILGGVADSRSDQGRSQPKNKADAISSNPFSVEAAKRHLIKATNLYILCVDQVDAMVKPHIEGITAELYQAAISSLFIESSRSGFIASMPETPLSAAKSPRKAI